MRTILTWLGRLVVGLIILIAILVAFIYVRSEQLVNQTFHAPNVTLTVPSDAASIERGHHLATVVARWCPRSIEAASLGTVSVTLGAWKVWLTNCSLRT